MKSYLIAIFTMLMLWIGFTSCSTDGPIPILPDAEQSTPPDNTDGSDNDDDNNSNDNNSMSNKLKITIGSTSFNATLIDNATVAAFKAKLPMTVDMSEMNGNEIYYYMSDNLPTSPSRPGTIRTGDLMLYGSSCVVLFYETFSTSYSYTRLGRVENPSKLASALGSESVTVTFELQ